MRKLQWDVYVQILYECKRPILQIKFATLKRIIEKSIVRKKILFKKDRLEYLLFPNENNSFYKILYCYNVMATAIRAIFQLKLGD